MTLRDIKNHNIIGHVGFSDPDNIFKRMCIEAEDSICVFLAEIKNALAIYLNIYGVIYASIYKKNYSPKTQII